MQFPPPPPPPPRKHSTDKVRIEYGGMRNPRVFVGDTEITHLVSRISLDTEPGVTIARIELEASWPIITTKGD